MRMAPRLACPLDIHLHWEWRNPLNIIPAFMVAMVLAAVIGLLVG
ncbi:MAG: hypothetical protein U0074_02795 [Kouleothrix sp.]